MKDPKVTVLMPVYNGEKYLKDAIESILCQDFTDFEFLIINDGSKDDSENIIRSFSDGRIRLVNNEMNIGLVNTLNKGFDLAKGQYIARMDCDDLSLKNRLKVQVDFMDQHPEVAVCGSYYYLLLNGKKAVADFPLTAEELSSYLIFNSPIAHPSAILRTSLIREKGLKYDSRFIHAEDYDLWSRISEHAGLANIPAVLLTYRVHENQVTENPALVGDKMKSVDALRQRHLKNINILPSVDELLLHNLISNGKKAASEEQVMAAEAWLKKITLSAKRQNAVEQSYLGKIILERWFRLCFNYFGGRKGLQYFLRSELFRSIHLPWSRKIELMRSIYYSYKRKGIKN